MARNIEIKARIENVALLAPRWRSWRPRATGTRQDDTFFNCTTGRLKLRAFSNDAAN
jgi:hypothetical protein